MYNVVGSYPLLNVLLKGKLAQKECKIAIFGDALGL
jgi:hypothetical protein